MTLSGTRVADPYFAAARPLAPTPAPAPVPLVGDEVDEVVAAVLARVGVFTADLWSALTPDRTAEHDPDVCLRAAERDSEVRVEAHVTDPAPAPALDRLRAELEQRGWEVAPSSDSEPLSAHLDGGTVTASYAEERLELTVDSAPLTVGAERAAELVRHGLAA